MNAPKGINDKVAKGGKKRCKLPPKKVSQHFRSFQSGPNSSIDVQADSCWFHNIACSLVKFKQFYD